MAEGIPDGAFTPGSAAPCTHRSRNLSANGISPQTMSMIWELRIWTFAPKAWGEKVAALGGANLHVEVSSHGDEIEIELLPPALQLHRTHTTQPITEHGARCQQGWENRFRRKKVFTWKLLVGTAGSPALFLYIYVFTIGFENIS